MMKRIKEFIIKNLKWIILFICLIGFLALAEDVFNEEIMNGDIVGYKIVSQFFVLGFATPVAKFITNFGGAVFLIATAVLLLILIKNKKIGVSICINLVLITALNQLLKQILQRPRPTEYRIIEESGYSFPSGHAMNGIVFYGFLVYLLYKMIKNKPLKYSLMILINIVVFLVGLSRIYLGVHYTSDVIAGYLFGFAYLIISISLLRKFNIIKGEIKNEATN